MGYLKCGRRWPNQNGSNLSTCTPSFALSTSYSVKNNKIITINNNTNIYPNVFRARVSAYCIFSFLFAECFTPNDLNGVCINIKRCPSLLMLLENQRKNSSIAAFLRNSMCGYEGRDPKVCCALDNENTDSSTQQQQSTRPPVTVTTTERVSGQSSAGENFETVRSAYLPSQNTCGRSNSSHIRIVGGVPADLG